MIHRASIILLALGALLALPSCADYCLSGPCPSAADYDSGNECVGLTAQGYCAQRNGGEHAVNCNFPPGGAYGALGGSGNSPCLTTQTCSIDATTQVASCN